MTLPHLKRLALEIYNLAHMTQEMYPEPVQGLRKKVEELSALIKQHG